MASRARFPVYRGEQPYIFISYAHADSAVVLPIAEQLHNRHYRVWYDEGIEAGTKWPQYIATHLMNASLVLFFTSERFNVSLNCEREVNFAVDAKKPIVCINLDDADFPAGIKMQLSTAPSVRAMESTVDTAMHLIETDALASNLIGDGVEGYTVESKIAKRRANAALIVGIIGIALAACFGLALLGYSSGWFGEKSGLASSTVSAPSDTDTGETQDITVTTWTSSVMRDLLISQTDGEALYCCGNAFVTARSAITYRGGAYLVGGETVERGDIEDLDSIGELTNLVELSLCYENINDLSGLSNLNKLTYLDLSGNSITDISTLIALSNLTILKVSHTSISDLTPALKIPSLKKLYVSYDMVSYIKDILLGKFELIVTE